ncbi:MAG: hypothetical protein MN733_03545 [Nitrososphaera sp.]|nr:hypothetical protein [Nitrososphaera sp.]
MNHTSNLIGKRVIIKYMGLIGTVTETYGFPLYAVRVDNTYDHWCRLSEIRILSPLEELALCHSE